MWMIGQQFERQLDNSAIEMHCIEGREIFSWQNEDFYLYFLSQVVL